MISGASEKELDLANARADIILALDNTATYESWLYIDAYIEKLEEEKQQLISFLKHLIGETECAYDYKENEYKNSGKWNLLNEILDFVNEGGKDE